ncbi:DUF3179 domain-containing protein [Jannaschia sp. CCS1]|uniref:DUF3179 domain-containing protein n=1 Tax=Jannaschia sp. (strain CCS1) TaxID=290400 RepID=UPI000053D473|nr:DUF3179 domain-containing protein [Jannaschia sp. CCS1]ABD55495.1 hypothetical protein Jann_2578 [Jannaschia sp. CCS1]
MTRLLLTALMCIGLSGAVAQAQDQGLPDYIIEEFGTPPAVPDGPLSEDLYAAISDLVTLGTNQRDWDLADRAAFDAVEAAGDPRVAWIITDMMRFAWRPEFNAVLTETAMALMEVEVQTFRHRAELIDHLMAWDMPAYDNYLDHKRTIFTNFIPGWERIFVDGDIDWHMVDWGGVLIDDRPYGRSDEVCNCIPAIDNPRVETAAEATWLDDDDIVFGIVLNGEARAYPRRIMEVREMVNDTLGGRDLGIPYCTLCGAAQAYFTDELPDGVDRPILRTSGLLIRSNKVMYDITTWSVFDTFTGRAVTGPLLERGIQLEQASVITTEWGAWREAHPDTTVLVEALALGRDFDFRNTRDANGPIFPVGDVDPRLAVQEDVIGVITASGQPVAFPRATALLALRSGAEVAVENIRLELDAGGIRAVDADGTDLGSHQAFWFAWSQFHPDTWLWEG